MAGKQTIASVSRDVQQFKRYVGRKFSESKRELKEELDPIRDQVKKLHDYMERSEGYKEGQAANGRKDGTISISKDAWWLIAKLVAIIGAVLAIRNYKP